MTTPSGKHPIDPLASVTREHAGLGHPGVKPSGSVLPWLLTMPSPDAPTRANERAGAERHPAENYHNPQPAVEPGITKSENVPLDESIRAPEGLREHPDWYTADAEECHFPRAAQLPAVPGLAPIDPVPGPAPSDRFLAVARVPEQPEFVGPPRATPRGKLRGPLAILIASICAVPIGYYIWMRGWSPFSDSPPGPQMASVGPTINAPRASIGHQELRLPMARDNDRGTSAPNEISSQRTETSQPAKSSEHDTVAMVQPSTNAAQTPTASKAARALDPEEIKLLMKQGEQLIATGDVVTARIVFQRAAESGDANAAIALGSTYDPTVFAKLGVMGIGNQQRYSTAEGSSSRSARGKQGREEARYICGVPSGQLFAQRREPIREHVVGKRGSDGLFPLTLQLPGRAAEEARICLNPSRTEAAPKSRVNPAYLRGARRCRVVVLGTAIES
jgi:hypothetical protein